MYARTKYIIGDFAIVWVKSLQRDQLNDRSEKCGICLIIESYVIASTSDADRTVVWEHCQPLMSVPMEFMLHDYKHVNS